MEYVSLILPTYNQNERLKIVLELLKEQNYDNLKYEVIIVDDGSTDETENVVKSIDSNYQLLYKKHKRNEGRAIARNSGAEMASGDILIFFDSDRIAGRNFINEHLKFHADSKKSVVMGNCLEVFTSNIECKIEEIINKFRNDEKKILRACRYFNYADSVIQIYNKEGKTKSGLAWLTLFSGNFSIRKQHFNKAGVFCKHKMHSVASYFCIGHLPSFLRYFFLNASASLLLSPGKDIIFA